MTKNIHREYPQLPQAAVGAVVIKGNKVLLVQRGKAPSDGLWAIPGGRIEIGESLQEAAEREILEETGVIIQAGDPIHTMDIIVRDESERVKYHYVIVDLLADYVSGEPRAGDDARDVAWVGPGDLSRLPLNENTRQVLETVFGFRET